MSERVRERMSKERERRGERKKSSQGVTQKRQNKKSKVCARFGRQCRGGHCEEYGRCLGGSAYAVGNK